jgi:phage terminase small subunit
MKKLTAKQEGFVKDFLETKNASEAVRRNYDVKDAKPGTITNLGSTNLA